MGAAVYILVHRFVPPKLEAPLKEHWNCTLCKMYLNNIGFISIPETSTKKLK